MAIAAAAAIKPSHTVLEIGPGQGSLTKVLLAAASQVVAVEKDEKLAANLRAQVSAANLRVITQDILKFDLTSLPAGYKVVANIPYYLTSNLIRVLCESENPFSVAVLLVQKEVAERAAAAPGQMSLLGVSAQYYCQVSLGKVVPAELFDPPPKVDSQILILKYRAQPLFENVDAKLLFRIVKAGFSQRRKTLTNSLSGGLKLERAEVTAALKQAKITPSIRAQALDLADWHRLYLAFLNGSILDNT